jgi:alpha-1,3-glucan synthase
MLKQIGVQAPNFINISKPDCPYLGWMFRLEDKSGRWTIEPRGNASLSMIIFALLLLMPPTFGLISVYIFGLTFYAVKVNRYGTTPPRNRKVTELANIVRARFPTTWTQLCEVLRLVPQYNQEARTVTPQSRRKILIATLEYEILGWNIKVR